MAVDKEKYGDLYQEHYFEQYKLYIASVEKISDRRESANRYFLTINSALFAIAGLIVNHAHRKESLLLACLSFVGLVVCIIFWFLINSYKQLNTAKFSMVHKIENTLPIELFKDEWDILGKGKVKKKYFPFSHVERLIPIIFGIAYTSIPVALWVTA